MIKKKNIRHSWLLFAVVLWITLSTALLITIVWPFNTDDAYITLRYAKHLAQGHGIVWNIGDTPSVEGYSNFVFVLIGALSIRLELDPMLVFKIICLFSLPVTCIMLYKLSRIWASPLVSLLPALILTTYIGTIWWTVSGLETSFYQMLSVATLLIFIKGFYTEANRWIISKKHLFLTGFFVFLLAITRPEGPIIGLALAITLILGIALRRIDFRSGLLGGIVLTLTFFAPYTVYMGWKIYHFERLIPNTVYCKGNYRGPYGQLFKDFISIAWPYVLLALLVFKKRFDLRLTTCLLVPAFYCVILYNTDPIIGHWNRHFLTSFALLLVVATVGIHDLVTMLQTRKTSTIQSWLLVFFFLISAFSWPVTATRLLKDTDIYVSRIHNRERLANWLNNNLSETDSYVIGDAGLIPYLTHSRVIDAYCLNCREMTTYPINMSNEKFVNTIMQQKPSVIIITSYSKTKLRVHTLYNVFPAFLREIYFLKTYHYAATFGTDNDSFNYWVYKLSENK